MPAHNYHFTLELHAKFTCDDSAGQVFTFIGDDDMYVYINKKLVIEIGGHHYPREQNVELDRRGLTNGQTYPMDIYYAERRTAGSNCYMSTTLLLEKAVFSPVSVSAAFD